MYLYKSKWEVLGKRRINGRIDSNSDSIFSSKHSKKRKRLKTFFQDAFRIKTLLPKKETSQG
jgi:hypothetical protein